MIRIREILFALAMALGLTRTNGFSVGPFLSQLVRAPTTTALQSSFAADGSEYSSSDSSDMDDDMDDSKSSYSRNYRDDDDETPTIELSPVPMSKNTGNRFVAFYWDAELNEGPNKDPLQLHSDRTDLTEEHVMFCRKRNLYNETFNQDSMVDVLWSLPMYETWKDELIVNDSRYFSFLTTHTCCWHLLWWFLCCSLSSDLRRLIGHAVCLESSALEHVHEFLAEEPLSRMLTGGDISKIPLYRWRHIRDYTLRIDDGRNGFPCMCVGMDYPAEEVGNDLRESVKKDMLEYMIRSERIIAAGPLHLPTEFKDDPSSLPVGDLILFNAPDRADAIDFIENMPAAQAGLYESLRVHFYNTLDITGKFVSEDPLRDAPCGDLKEAMEYWGYPVQDEQTPWLNW